MPDLAVIFARIDAQPDREPHRLALAAHLADNGEDDLAIIIRCHLSASRERMRDGVTAERKSTSGGSLQRGTRRGWRGGSTRRRRWDEC